MKAHTIGEVLNRLKDEFDDITISKIRFLEAEGLISPDRTESGYRKFSEHDINRLRYVLRAQRDRYLPLKVIKDELARLDAGILVETGEPGDEVPATTPAAASASPHATGRGGSILEGDASDLQLTESELVEMTGLSADTLAAMRTHALLGSGPRYNGEDLQIAKLTAQLVAEGLEVRHLRMYRQFADREYALVEQLVAPLLRQRNPDSRRSARERTDHLARAGGQLHEALLARQLRALLRS